MFADDPLLSDRIIPACAENARSASSRGYSNADHPRVRGERGHWARAHRSPAGSSPRARRTPDRTVCLPPERRIIPACAENAARGSQTANPPPDHPRVRGERLCILHTHELAVGSSPRARRTPGVESAGAVAARIIPACAENARYRSSGEGPPPDHPRVRGERGGNVSSDASSVGSSPRARRTLLGNLCARLGDRIIPACAENAHCLCHCAGRDADHPRVRGERPTDLYVIASLIGSSPRARRTLGDNEQLSIDERIIPACAENAVAASGRRSSARDHPRVRGERSVMSIAGRGSTGSSPRARRTPEPETGDAPLERIIPACAENARPPGATSTRRSDHPRVRGERFGTVSVTRYRVGSSPRARRTPTLCRPFCHAHRIIPACAENALARTARPCSPTDHPRVRGERPPLERRHLRDIRIIPACAENAGPLGVRPMLPADHPRVRGERLLPKSAESGSSGSSPRARRTRGQARCGS